MSNKITTEVANEAYDVLMWVKRNYPEVIDISDHDIHNISVILEENCYDD